PSLPPSPCYPSLFLFLTYTSTTQIYTLSLHDALPISRFCTAIKCRGHGTCYRYNRYAVKYVWYCCVNCFLNTTIPNVLNSIPVVDRKSTRLNSSHVSISYAVFCLKKKIQILYHYVSTC